MEIDVRDLFNILIKQIWIYIIVLIIFVGGSLLFFKLKNEKVYSVTSNIMVSVNEDSDYFKNNQETSVMDAKIIETYIPILKSNNVLNKVIKDVKLDMTFLELQEIITVERLQNTYMLQINLVYNNKDLIFDISNSVINNFISEIKDVYNMLEFKVVSLNDEPLEENSIDLYKLLILAIMSGIFIDVLILLFNYYSKRRGES